MRNQNKGGKSLTRITRTLARSMLMCWVLSFIGGFLLNNVWAETEEEPLHIVRGARPLGLGNAFEAIADDENAFHYNPAGLAQNTNTLFYLLPVRARITMDLASELEEIQELVEAIGAITDSKNPLDDPGLVKERKLLVNRLEEAIEEQLGATLDLPSIGLAIPTHIAGIKCVLGGTFYTQSTTSFRVEQRGIAWGDPIKDMLDNVIIYRSSAQWALAGACAIEIPVNRPPIVSKAYLGISFRWIDRWIFTDEADPLVVEEALNYRGPDGIEDTDDDFINRFFEYDEGDSALDIVNNNFKQRTGYSADIGTIVSPLDGMNIAFVVRNAISNVDLEDDPENMMFPRNVVLSAAAKPLRLMGIYSSPIDITVAASVDSLNGDDRLKEFSIDEDRERIHLGLEAILWPKRPFSLAGRIGNNQGFLTIGAALKMGALHLEVARYGDLQADWYVGSINFIF